MSDDVSEFVEELVNLLPRQRQGRAKGPAAGLGVSLNDMREMVTLATPARAMTDAFRDWASENAFGGASFAVLRRGRVVTHATYGTGSANEPTEFASCSKFISGLAIAQLVRQGKLKWDTTMEEIFGPIFRTTPRRLREIQMLRDPRKIDIVSKFEVADASLRRRKAYDFPSVAATSTTSQRRLAKSAVAGAKIRPIKTKAASINPFAVMFPDWFRPLTITEVMTHTSGIRGDLGEGNPYEISMDDRFELIVTVMVPGPKVYYYENNNYLVLGKVIERITGKTFEEAVKELVFKPLGISAFSADSRGPYAGCWLSTVNYARMLRYLDRDLGLMGAFGPDSWPRVKGYSIGARISGTKESFRAEHGGAWNWHDGVRAVSYGAHFYNWQDIRTGYFVRYTPSNNFPHWDLYDKLQEIAHSTDDAWPLFVETVGQLYDTISKRPI